MIPALLCIWVNTAKFPNQTNQIPAYSIIRDEYGVPKITSATLEGVFFGQGYSTTEDRMWQMDMSRHLAEGHLASLIGESGLASDESVDKTGYTEGEEMAQFDNLPTQIQQAFKSYTAGVNKYIADAENGQNGALLPPEYSKFRIKPEVWSVYDSVAISIRLFQLFGRGGAGEIRDWALLQYLQARPNLKGKALDVFNDIAWINDPSSPTTVSISDDLSAKPHPEFPTPTNQITAAQLNSLPKLSLFELFPALNVAEGKPSKLMAEKLGVPFRTGSYCVAVNSKRSASGTPILLSAPQMGFSQPSIIHETALRSPSFRLTGIDVPGVPGIAIGSNGKVTWGITSGVADTEDTFVYKTMGDSYLYSNQSFPIGKISFHDPVLGGKAVTIVQKRTNWGPIALDSPANKAILVLRSAAWQKELASFNALFGLYSASTAKEADVASQKATMSFNLFFADKAGNIGWRYCGIVPLRNALTDPRLPLLANPANAWKGFIPQDKMPHCMNPSSGLIYNWNNKPAKWWRNGDTPVWGSIFQSSLIGDLLTKPSLSVQDVEHVPWAIAREDPSFNLLKKFLILPDDPGWLKAYDGWNLDGSFAADGWHNLLENVRKALFGQSVGSLISQSFFDEVLQPSLILKALEGQTHFNYLAGRSTKQIVEDAKENLGKVLRFQANTISVDGQSPILYSNRGSVIMISEIGPDGKWSMRSNLPPGESENGTHKDDQVNLAKQWFYKQTWLGR